MAVQTVENVQRLAPYLEGLEKRLLGTAFGEFSGASQTSPGLLDKPLGLPQYQVAGLDPLQQQALSAAPQMFGSYLPFTMGAGMQGLAGASALQQGVGMLDPSQGISAFMNPYQSAVIDEINRQAATGQQKLGGQRLPRCRYVITKGWSVAWRTWTGIWATSRHHSRCWACAV